MSRSDVHVTSYLPSPILPGGGEGHCEDSLRILVAPFRPRRVSAMPIFSLSSFLRKLTQTLVRCGPLPLPSPGCSVSHSPFEKLPRPGGNSLASSYRAGMMSIKRH